MAIVPFSSPKETIVNRIFATSLILLVILPLASTGIAQSTSSAPAGYEHQEGNGPHCRTFGFYHNGHHQFAVDTFKNQGRKLFKKVGYRRDGRWFATTNGENMARTFSRVTLSIGETNIATFQTVFSQNIVATTTPVQVFDSALKWPSLKSKPPSTPAPWTASLAFPFKSVLVYSGKNDLLLDYQFRGGVLANSQIGAGYYYLDSAGVYYAKAGVPGHRSRLGFGCIDSVSFSRQFSEPFSFTYGPNHPVATYRDKIEVYSYNHFIPPSTSFIQAIDLRGSTAGVAFNGITCQKLHVAGSEAMVLFPLQSTTGTATKNPFPGLVPYKAAYVGLTIWSQCLWNDSVTKALKLGAAGTVTIGKQQLAYTQKSVYAYQSYKREGYLTVSPYHIPVALFTH